MGSIVGRLPSAARPTSFRYQVIAVGLRNGHVTSRLGVASTGTTVYQPGELVLFTNSSSQRPTWLSLDGYVYDVS